MSIASQKRLVSQTRRALLGMRARPRSGKVARLPYATRERIRFAPGLLPNTMRMSNRPTFQQVVEFAG